MPATSTGPTTFTGRRALEVNRPEVQRHGVWGPTPNQQRFEVYDTSGDGRLNIEEVHGMLTSLGFDVTMAAVSNVFQNIDVNESGYIEYGQFKRLWALLDSRPEMLLRSAKVPSVQETHKGEMTKGLPLQKMLRPRLTLNASNAKALREASKRGDLPTVRAILERMAEDPLNTFTVNDADPLHDCETALHVAATAGHADVVRALLSSGASPLLTTSNGWTPLFSAALWGHTAALAELLGGGAVLTQADVHGKTAHDLAMSYGQAEAAKMLQGAGAPTADGTVTMLALAEAERTEAQALDPVVASDATSPRATSPRRSTSPRGSSPRGSSPRGSFPRASSPRSPRGASPRRR